MDTEHLTSLLRNGTSRRPEPADCCPDEHEIAAFVDSTLEPADRERVEQHLADCRTCRSRTALLGQLAAEDVPAETVPELVMARARRLEGCAQTPLRRWGHEAPIWATAAAVLVAGFVAFEWLDLGGRPDSLSLPQQRTAMETPASISPPQLLFPSEGVTLDANRIVLRWTEVPAALYYEVHVITASGDLVTKQRVTGTEWRARKVLNLQPGAEYFVRIAAYLSDDQTLSSEHVAFEVAGP